MKIQRVKNMSEDQFMEEYLIPKIPVIVTDAMQHWDVKRFTPDNLKEQFGDFEVQVYNNLFDLQTVDTLETYLNKNFDKKETSIDAVIEYARWFTKFRDIDFFWSDEVFEALKAYWQHPYFLPKKNMILPFDNGNKELNVHESSFPYKGLFLSGKGGKTRLHKDPLNTNALLCQLYGTKELVLYSPDQESFLVQNNEYVDIDNPDLDKFPAYRNAAETYRDILSPGEIVLFPSGWFHDVTSRTDSVSITWNFVHSRELNQFCEYLNTSLTEDQMEVVHFFIKDFLQDDTIDAQSISSFYNKISQKRKKHSLVL